MDGRDIRTLLEGVRDGGVTVDAAVAALGRAPFDDIGFAKIDRHRALRQGAAEVVFGAGKTPEQVCAIVRRMREDGTKTVLATRLRPEASAALFAVDPCVDFDPLSRLAVVGEKPEPDGKGEICVCCAGTSDLPVAEEAARTAEALGNRVVRLTDVGVAGLHRLLAHLEELQRARVVIAIAGMEGALASVVGGLVAAPVLAVPTSVGYGASFGGVSALLSMLNSCASGVSVLNIDNGFGAGFLASRINHLP